MKKQRAKMKQLRSMSNKHYLLCLLLGLLFSINSFAKAKILVFEPEGDQFEMIYKGLKNDLASNYGITRYIIENESTSKEFENIIVEKKPSLLVLMDNLSVKLAMDYYSKNPKSKIQSVAIMGLNYKKILAKNKNICGIAFEVPLYTLFTQQRALMKSKKLENVLVFYRGSQFSEMIKQSKSHLKIEKINLVAIDVEKKAKDKDITNYLMTDGAKYIMNDKKYDTIYVMLDSKLLTRELFSKFWITGSRNSKIPYVAGVKNFVKPEMDFAMYGMSPNIPDLISQTSQMIENLIEEGESCKDLGVEELIGVNKFWNLKKSKKLNIELNEKLRSTITILD